MIMKKKTIKLYVLAAVFLATAVIAAVYLATRPSVPAGRLHIAYDGGETEVVLTDLDLRQVSGVLTNGKGEQKTVEARGIPVADVLVLTGANEYSEVTVTADDTYSAVLTEEEVRDTENTYFLLQEDGGVQLAVFSDTNSKRNVSGVVRVEVS